MARFPGEIDGRRFLRARGRFGWRVVKQRGSHRKLVHADRADFLTVAFHGTLSGHIVRRILRQAGIDEDDFLRAL